MTFSINNRIVTEQYIKKALEPKKQGGIATPGQRDSVEGLKVLVSTTLSDGRFIPKGSIVYIREEALHTHAWASKPLNCVTLPQPFLLIEASYVEFIVTPDNPDDAA